MFLIDALMQLNEVMLDEIRWIMPHDSMFLPFKNLIIKVSTIRLGQFLLRGYGNMSPSRIMATLRIRKVILVLLFVVIIALGVVVEPIRIFLFVSLLAIVVGWFISLPLWLTLRFKPSVRVSAHANRRIRLTMIGIVLLLVLPTVFVLYTFLRSYVTVIFYSVIISDPFPAPAGQYRPQFPSPSEIVQRHGGLMTKELWYRQVAFPPLWKSCYSSVDICGLVDDMVVIYDTYSHPNWAEYLSTIGISLALSFPGPLFAWLYTHPPKDGSCGATDTGVRTSKTLLEQQTMNSSHALGT